MQKRKFQHNYAGNKMNPTKEAQKSHHWRSPGSWMPTVAREYLHPEVRLYPSLSQLDGDWS